MSELPRLAATVGIGLLSGVLSGMFGIGGGIVTTPAIRLLLGEPALVAVGTPLAAILPSALTGSVAYARQGVADVKSGLVAGSAGSLTAVVGAWLTQLAGGSFVLLVTAALVVYVAVDMVRQALAAETPDSETEPPAEPPAGAPATARRPQWWRVAVVGAAGGFYSGFLGLGGGLVLVPLMTRWLRMPIKTAIATSLTAMAVLSVPGIITHSMIGNVDWAIAMGLVAGVVPGAALGARVTLRSSDRAVRLSFAALLVAAGFALALTELSGLAS